MSFTDKRRSDHFDDNYISNTKRKMQIFKMKQTGANKVDDEINRGFKIGNKVYCCDSAEEWVITQLRGGIAVLIDNQGHKRKFLVSHLRMVNNDT